MAPSRLREALPPIGGDVALVPLEGQGFGEPGREHGLVLDDEDSRCILTHGSRLPALGDYGRSTIWTTRPWTASTSVPSWASRAFSSGFVVKRIS